MEGKLLDLVLATVFLNLTPQIGDHHHNNNVLVLASQPITFFLEDKKENTQYDIKKAVRVK